MKKKNKTVVPRNPFIRAAFNNEINLSTKVEKDKTKYSRKEKHKSKDY